MASIAALSLLLTLARPLARDGTPPCLTLVQTSRWLVALPGVARCADCHGQAEAIPLGGEWFEESGPTDPRGDELYHRWDGSWRSA